MRTELGSWRRAWRRVGKAEVEVEVDADMVEEKLEEEARRRKRMARRRRASTLIKSNNPHLAGGKLYVYFINKYMYIYIYPTTSKGLVKRVLIEKVPALL